MKILLLDSNYLEYEAKKKAIKKPEELKKEKEKIGNCLVVFACAEEGDTVGISGRVIRDIKEVASQIDKNKIVLYPWVHLSNNPASPKTAMKIFDKVKKDLEGENFKVHKSPFGWYKAFNISVKGHPLAELSREIREGEKEEEEKEEREASEFHEFIVVDKNGKEYEINKKNFEKSPIFKKEDESYQRLKQFVKNELQGTKGGKKPKHIEYMQRLELVDYCKVSESGNYKWYPKGLLIRKLLLDYASELAKEWGASEILNPIIIKSGENEVGELMGEFHERDYKVDGGRGICYLRYASDPLGFPFMQKINFSYKQTPLKIYEEASCFRNEQEGEVSGLKRVRSFLMTDMHAACKSKEQAKEEYIKLCKKFKELMNDIVAQGRWILGWEGTEKFYINNKKWLIQIGKDLGVPAFFKLMPKMSHYYVIKNEFQTILEDKSNIQVSTVQWDVKDGERFDISYVGKDNKKHPCPVILHASSFGSIERTLASILENIAIDEKQGKPPMLPLWLSPTQVRLCPLNEEMVEYANKIADQLEKNNIRVDIDDRDESISKKVRDAEVEWVPMTIVIGPKEKKAKKLPVRYHKDGKKAKPKKKTIKQIIKEINKETKGMPYRPLPLQRKLTQRPIFRG